MLSITPAAARAIESLLDSEGRPGGGVRIARQWSATGDDAPLVFTLESIPRSGDEVIVLRGARLFLAPEAAPLLAEVVLDARVGEASVEFCILTR